MCASFTSASPLPKSLIDLSESTAGVRMSFCHTFVPFVPLEMSPHGQIWSDIFLGPVPGTSHSAFQFLAVLSVVFITPDPSLVISHLVKQAQNWSWLGYFSCVGDVLQLQSSALCGWHTPDGETQRITLTCPLSLQPCLSPSASLALSHRMGEPFPRLCCFMC